MNAQEKIDQLMKAEMEHIRSVGGILNLPEADQCSERPEPRKAEGPEGTARTSLPRTHQHPRYSPEASRC